jgi:hypothetical protein
MIDPARIVETYLRQSGSPLYEEVESRVYVDPPGLPRDLEVRSAVSLAVLPGGGMMSPPVPVETVFMELRCWAANPLDANEVAATLHETLHGVRDVNVDVSDGAGGTTTYRIKLALREGAIRVSCSGKSPQRWRAVSTWKMYFLSKAYTG